MEKLTYPIEGGTRVTIKDKQDELLKAELPNEDDDRSPTIYWRARVQLDQLVTFFRHHAPEASEELYSALVFSPVSRLRIEGRSSIRSLLDELPEQANFVRFEHASIYSTRDGISNTGTIATDFTLWSRLDLWAIPKTESAPDYVGVSAKSEWLRSIAEPLAEFVSQTHIADISLRAALDSVHSALQHPTPA